jgi:hypothetical protein
MVVMISAESGKNAACVGTFLTLAMPMLCNFRSRRVTQRLAETGTWGDTAEPNPIAKKRVRAGDPI